MFGCGIAGICDGKVTSVDDATRRPCHDPNSAELFSLGRQLRHLHHHLRWLHVDKPSVLCSFPNKTPQSNRQGHNEKGREAHRQSHSAFLHSLRIRSAREHRIEGVSLAECPTNLPLTRRRTMDMRRSALCRLSTQKSAMTTTTKPFAAAFNPPTTWLKIRRRTNKTI